MEEEHRANQGAWCSLVHAIFWSKTRSVLPGQLINTDLGNGYYTRSLCPMDRVFLAVICAGIVLLVAALALGTPQTSSDGLTTGLHKRILPR